MGRPRRQEANYQAEGRLERRLQYASKLGGQYLAEHRVTLTQVRMYLSALQAEPWFWSAWPGEVKPITVMPSKTDTSYSSRAERTIASHPSHRKRRAQAELVILHELAHIITKDPHEGRPRRQLDDLLSRGHTKAWREHYARLVGATLGPRWARRLR